MKGDGAAPRRWSGIVVGCAWIASLAATVLALHGLGHGSLAAPPVGSLARLRSWLDDRDTALAAFAVLRVVALAMAWYLLAVTVLGFVARLVRNPKLVRLADVATLPVVRRWLGAIAGLGLSASTATLAAVPFFSHPQHQSAPTAVTAAPDDRDGDRGRNEQASGGEIVLRRLPDGSEVVMERIPDPHDHNTATMRVMDGTATLRLMDQGEGPRSSGARPAPPAAPAPLATWTIQPGDHFWHVARAVLTEAWKRPPSDVELLPYWRLLVEHNRSRLADPANPDLVYPGQVLELPGPPPPP